MSIKYIVRRAEDQKWCVKNAKAGKPTGIFETQKAAIDYAESLKSTSGILIQSKDGKFRKVSSWDVAYHAAPSKSAAKKTKKEIIRQAKYNHKKYIANQKALKANKKAPVEKSIIKKVDNPDIIKEHELLKKEIQTLEVRLAEQQDVKKALKKFKSKTKRVLIAFEIILLLAIIAAGVLFTLDWQETIKFIDIIKVKK